AIVTRATHVDGDPAVLQGDGLLSIEGGDREARPRHASVIAEVSGRASDPVSTHRRFGAVSVEDPHPGSRVRAEEQDAVDIQPVWDRPDEGALARLGDR